MSLQATVGCRAQYVNSASVTVTGEATLHLAAVAETYTLSYPALYARSDPQLPGTVRQVRPSATRHCTPGQKCRVAEGLTWRTVPGS